MTKIVNFFNKIANGNFVEKNDNFCQFLKKKCQVFVNFLTVKWQFSGGSATYQTYFRAPHFLTTDLTQGSCMAVQAVGTQTSHSLPLCCCASRVPWPSTHRFLQGTANFVTRIDPGKLPPKYTEQLSCLLSLYWLLLCGFLRYKKNQNFLIRIFN